MAFILRMAGSIRKQYTHSFNITSRQHCGAFWKGTRYIWNIKL